MKTTSLLAILAVLIVALAGINSFSSDRAAQTAASAQGAAHGNGNGVAAQSAPTQPPAAAPSTGVDAAVQVPQASEQSATAATLNNAASQANGGAQSKRPKFWVLSDDEIASLLPGRRN